MFRLVESGSVLAIGLISVQLAAQGTIPSQTAYVAQTPVQVQAPVQVQTPAQNATPAQTAAQPSTQTPVQQTAAPADQAAKPVAIPPPTPEELGDTLVIHQRYQAALAAYAKAPPSAIVWNKMGIAYQMMFNLKEATRCYKESLALEPKNPNVLNNLGTIYDSLKEYGQAEKYYKKSLKQDPKAALVLKNLGTNLLTQHKTSRGWEMYQQALAIDPMIFEDRNSPQVQNPTSLEQRGVMNYYMALGCVRIGQTACALQYLRMAMDEGYTTPKKVASDLAFASLRDNPDFKLLLASQKNAKATQSR
jgi:tetratricopeptide (TPR) repeat protein